MMTEEIILEKSFYGKSNYRVTSEDIKAIKNADSIVYAIMYNPETGIKEGFLVCNMEIKTPKGYVGSSEIYRYYIPCDYRIDVYNGYSNDEKLLLTYRNSTTAAKHDFKVKTFINCLRKNDTIKIIAIAGNDNTHTIEAGLVTDQIALQISNPDKTDKYTKYFLMDSICYYPNSARHFEYKSFWYK